MVPLLVPLKTFDGISFWNFSQLWFWSWGFFILWLCQHNCSWVIFLFLLLRRILFIFGIILFYLKGFLSHSLAIIFTKDLLPRTILSSLDQVKHSFQQVSTYFWFLYYLILSQNNFCQFSGLFWLTKEVPDSFDLWPQENHPSFSLVPSTKITKDLLVHSSKFSNSVHCKFGPELPFLMEFIFSFFQKFWEKSGTLWMHQEASSPSFSSR